MYSQRVHPRRQTHEYGGEHHRSLRHPVQPSLRSYTLRHPMITRSRGRVHVRICAMHNIMRICPVMSSRVRHQDSSVHVSIIPDVRMRMRKVTRNTLRHARFWILSLQQEELTNYMH